tara:strand:+ start:736 stop:876 length:141 start_codon:yes stop_codon:yes gene_type:complete
MQNDAAGPLVLLAVLMLIYELLEAFSFFLVVPLLLWALLLYIELAD